MGDVIPRPPYNIEPSGPPPDVSNLPSNSWAADEDPTSAIRDIMTIVRRRLWLVALLTVLGLVLAYYLVGKTPARYAAKAVIRIQDQSASMAPGMMGGMLDANGGIATQLQIFKTRAVLGPVVDREGLRLRSSYDAADDRLLSGISTRADLPSGLMVLHFKPDHFTVTGSFGGGAGQYGTLYSFHGLTFAVKKPADRDSAVYRVRDRETVIERLAPNLLFTPRVGTPVVDVMYQSPDRYQAQRIVNAAVQVFKDFNADVARQQSIRRRVFLEEQLVGAKSMLRQAQDAMSSFRRRETVLSVDELFSAEQASLTNLEMRRDENSANRQVYTKLIKDLDASSSSDKISASLEKLIASPDFSGNSVISSLYSQLVRAETDRDALQSGPFSKSATSPEMQLANQQIASFKSRIADAIRSQLAWMDVRMEASDSLVDRTKAVLQRLPNIHSEEERLAYETSSVSGLVDQLEGEYQKAKLAENVEVGNVEIIDQAGLPFVPISSGKPLKIGMGMTAGLILGILASILLENLDSTIRRRDELTQVLHLADLGFIPRLIGAGDAEVEPGRLRTFARGAARSARGQRALVANAPSLSVESPVAEAFSTLRTNLLFSQHLQKLKSVLITSAAPGEGKTTTAANLALAYAKHGFRVLLIDCDLRRPKGHRLFGRERSPGVSDVAAQMTTLRAAIQSTDVPGLDLLAAGSPAPNSTEILGSGGMRSLIEEATGDYDITIVDTAPLVVGSDAAILSVVVDGVVLVVRAGHTDRNMIHLGMRQLQTVGARVIGAVLNDSDGAVMKYEGRRYGYYGYAYGGYGSRYGYSDAEVDGE